MGKSILITFGVIIIAVICWLSAGYIIKNPDEILYQTTDSLYVKQYKIYNTDSVVCAFKKPQQYVGIISDKYTYRYINGVPGKPNLGLKISYHTTIIYDNKIYKTNSSEIYHEYNEGDKVKIKSLDWYNDNKDYDGNVECGFYYFIEEMTKYCGKILTIGNIHKNGYDLQEDENFAWTDEMFDSIIETHDDVESKASSDSEKMVSLKMICEYLDKELYTSYDYFGNIQTVSKNAVSKEDFIKKLCKEIELC